MPKRARPRKGSLPGRRKRPSEPERPQDPFALACRYLAARERTVHQVREHLRRKGVGEEEIGAAIAELLKKRLIDDGRYARLYVESRSRRAPRAGRLLIRELQLRGVGEEVARRAVEDLLSTTSEEDLARRVLEKLALESEADRLRAARRLKSRGFNPAIALRERGDAGDDPDRGGTPDPD